MRISASELARTLNSTSQPLYVLDDESTIVYCNRACHEWLGDRISGLIGRQCVYHSGAQLDKPAEVAAGLCPPPEALTGRPMTAAVSRSDADGGICFRRATFFPLGTCAEDLIGLVAVVDSEDLAEYDLPLRPAYLDGPSTADSHEDLHDQVLRFRRKAVARYGADRLVGNSPAVRRVRAQVELAVGTHASVLLVGPPGSGRQHVAGAIHYHGDPATVGSLIPLACSVLGADLIRSTVLALATKDALGEDSARSTLLLNEADQLPSEVQRELFTVLASRSFRLRLIATAEGPLDELVRVGTFRPDLAALLSTITIELPPLIDRREDLPVLSQLFVEENNLGNIKQLGGFTSEALDQLDAYSWPGNLDELAQVVAEAHRQAEGPRIAPADLPERIRFAAQAQAYPRKTEETIVLDEFLGRVERELISRALSQAKGNKAKAARLLGLSRPRLYRRLVQLGLDEEIQDEEERE